MSTILTVTDLTKRYGDTVAVNAISFAVRPREIVGLLGPNGAGKTTTINMVLGVLAPNAGHITINGVDLAKHPSKAKAYANFAAVYAPLPGNLTVLQNLRVFGMMYCVPDLRARIETVIGEYNLQQYRHTKCGLLSSGEQTRVALAKAMLNKPALLLLDEPTASLDPATARDLRRQIRAQTSAGTGGVLWTSHNMAEVEEVCDRVLFLSHGNVLLEGDPKTLPATHGVATLEDLFIRIAREPLAEPIV